MKEEKEEVGVGVASPAESRGKYVCRVCGAAFDTMPQLAAHFKSHPREEREAAKEPEEVAKPPEVEEVEEAIAFVEERIAQVHGVEKRGRMIVQALRDNPAPLRDANTLHSFIKYLAPRADDAQLSVFVVGPLYARHPGLSQAVDRLLSRSAPTYAYLAQPHYQPPAYVHYPYAPPPPHAPQPPYYASPYYGPYYAYPPRPQRTYKVVVDGQEVETDEAGLMAWQRFLREREEHELRMKKLEVEIKKVAEEASRREEPRVPVRVGDREVEVPASVAHLYLRQDAELLKRLEGLERRLEEEREARHRAEVEALRRELEELKRRPSFIEELRAYQEAAAALGFHRGGRTTVDLLESLADRIDQRAAQLIERMSPSGWRPEVRRTPEERARRAEEVMKRLEEAEEIMRLEEELARAASRLRPRGG